MPQQVNREEMIETLKARRGAAFIGFHADYDMNAKGKMKKSGYLGPYLVNNPWLGLPLRKIAHTNMLVTFDYDRAMLKRSDGAEGAKGGPTWQQRVVRADGTLTPLTTHKNDVELPAHDARFYISGEFQFSESRFNVNGVDVPKELVAPFLPTREDKWVNWRTVALENVHSINMDGETYIIA